MCSWNSKEATVVGVGDARGREMRLERDGSQEIWGPVDHYKDTRFTRRWGVVGGD